MALRPFVVLTLGLVSFGSAKQIDMGLPGPPPMDMGSVILSQNMLRINLESATGGKGGTTKGRRASTRAAGKASPTYASSKAVRSRVLTRFLAYVDKSYSPTMAANLRKFFTQGDFVATWAKAGAADGLRPGDLADSMTGYWAVNYGIAHDQPAPTAGQVRTLRQAIGRTMASNAGLARMSDARKQEISETLMLTSLLQAMGAKTVREANDPALWAKMRRGTVAGFKKVYGVDLTTLNLPANG